MQIIYEKFIKYLFKYIINNFSTKKKKENKNKN